MGQLEAEKAQSAAPSSQPAADTLDQTASPEGSVRAQYLDEVKSQQEDPKKQAAVNKAFDIARTAIENDYLEVVPGAMDFIVHAMGGKLPASGPPTLRARRPENEKAPDEKEMQRLRQESYDKALEAALAAARAGNFEAALQSIDLAETIRDPSRKYKYTPQVLRGMDETSKKLAVRQEAVNIAHRFELEFDIPRSMIATRIDGAAQRKMDSKVLEEESRLDDVVGTAREEFIKDRERLKREELEKQKKMNGSQVAAHEQEVAQAAPVVADPKLTAMTEELSKQKIALGVVGNQLRGKSEEVGLADQNLNAVEQEAGRQRRVEQDYEAELVNYEELKKRLDAMGGPVPQEEMELAAQAQQAQKKLLDDAEKRYLEADEALAAGQNAPKEQQDVLMLQFEAARTEYETVKRGYDEATAVVEELEARGQALDAVITSEDKLIAMEEDIATFPDIEAERQKAEAAKAERLKEFKEIEKVHEELRRQLEAKEQEITKYKESLEQSGDSAKPAPDASSTQPDEDKSADNPAHKPSAKAEDVPPVGTDAANLAEEVGIEDELDFVSVLDEEELVISQAS
ncbi:MAG: hypothetical protein J5J00_10410 [Deltaproteobacteria bacterium]|nr:hypothetical protein [Deltaproteobacteria bacterium]